MTRKHFEALAQMVLDHNKQVEEDNTSDVPFTARHMEVLANFCQNQNPNFDRDRFLKACGYE